MKKLVALIFILVELLFWSVQWVSAQSGCETNEMTCSELDYRFPNGCVSPCVRVITQPGGPGGRGAPRPPLCACKQPNQPGSIPAGGECQRDQDCVPAAPYCWGNITSWPPTCHVDPAGPATSTLSPFCNPSDPNSGVNTAIGCIKTNPTEFIKTLLSFATGIAGGIAFLLILLGGFQMMTSAGNPERLNAGRELVTSAITGLLLIIFSIFLLRVIGVNILGIPTFK